MDSAPCQDDVESLEVAWVRTKLKLIGVADAWKAEHSETVSNFIHGCEDCGRMFAWTQPDGELQLASELPKQWNEVLLLVRDPSQKVTIENIKDLVQYVVLRGSPGESMLRLMQNLYLPLMLENTSWQQANVSKDFIGELDRFMASLTESLFRAKGRTVLYVPPVRCLGEAAGMVRDKDIAKRLESIVIRWTRQIKEVVRSQDSVSDSESLGPLAEVEFWRRRSLDLGGIREQTNHSGVVTICNLLEKFKSPYLQPFLNLSKKIEQEAVVAEENLKFLTVLEEPCKELSMSTPRDIPFVLPKLLQRIRMIWKVSPFYNTPEKITGLLCKLWPKFC